MTIHYWALFVAAIAAFAFGGIWYGPIFSKAWVASLGKTPEQLKANARPMPILFGATFIAELVIAWALAGLMGHLALSGITVGVTHGLVVGLVCAVAFVITTLIVAHGYQGARWTQTFIDGGHWLGVFAIEGAIVGALGVG